MTFDIVIIGSGLGGLLSGFLLSREGKKVCLLEQHHQFGGNLQSFRRDDYTFDTGMHYVGSLAPGQSLHRYWYYFGLTELPWLQMDRDGFDRISFDNGEFPIAQGFDHFREQLVPHLPGSEAALKSYTDKLLEIANSHPLYNLELPLSDVRDSFHSQNASAYLNDLSAGLRHPANTVGLESVLTGNNLLYAGDPATTPLHQYGLINHSFISSAWRLAGGSQQIANHLVSGIRNQGGELLVNKKVTGIAKDAAGFIVSTADGDRFASRQVISGIHPEATLRLLDGIPVQKAHSERISGLGNTVSAFSLYIGLKPRSFPYLNHNVYHFTTDKTWTSETSSEKNWPSGYLLMTPPEINQGAWAASAVILSPVRYNEFSRWEASRNDHREESYLNFKSEKARLLLELVCKKFPGLKEAISITDSSTPLTWKDLTGTPDGSMYGIVRSAADPLRTVIFPRTKIPGLFLTGQNINLHGAVGVTIGAVMTCGEILGLPAVLKTIKNAL